MPTIVNSVISINQIIIVIYYLISNVTNIYHWWDLALFILNPPILNCQITYIQEQMFSHLTLLMSWRQHLVLIARFWDINLWGYYIEGERKFICVAQTNEKLYLKHSTETCLSEKRCKCWRMLSGAFLSCFTFLWTKVISGEAKQYWSPVFLVWRYNYMCVPTSVLDLQNNTYANIS